MKSFIAYFDFLGFQNFIEKNDLTTQKKVMGQIYRDIELAMGVARKNFLNSGRNAIPDISESKLNCINFSDTVVFWTLDDSESSLSELIKVAHEFNRRAIESTFPVRGSIVFGEIIHNLYDDRNINGAQYAINSVFGYGIIIAHQKTQRQNWAGTVLDNSLIEELQQKGYNVDEYLRKYATRYRVPYKKNIELNDEFVLNLITGSSNDKAIENVKRYIRENFSRHNKAVDAPDIQEKLTNTFFFLESYKTRNNEMNSYCFNLCSFKESDRFIQASITIDANSIIIYRKKILISDTDAETVGRIDDILQYTIPISQIIKIEKTLIDSTIIYEVNDYFSAYKIIFHQSHDLFEQIVKELGIKNNFNL